MNARIDDPALDVDASSVLSSERGTDRRARMPEWGSPI
jgi:hypothetical protein